MKVLIWTQYFWPEHFRINDLVVSLKKNDIDVTVLTGKPNYPTGRVFPGYSSWGIDQEQWQGVDVIRIPLFPRGKGGGLRLGLNYLSFIISGYCFAPWALRGRSFDAVFVYAPSPLLQAMPAVAIAALKKASLTVWVQDLWPESLVATGFVKNKITLRVVEKAVRYIYHAADAVMIQSEAFREPVARLVQNVRKIYFFPNAAEVMVPSVGKSATESLLCDISSTFSVVFAGNLGQAQSCQTILDASERLLSHSDIKIFLVGDGSASAFLRTEILRRNLKNIFMTGHLPAEQMPSIFFAASVLLVTLRDDDALASTIPSKLQTYLAAGKPIIASLNGEGAKVVLAAEAGLVSPAGDAVGLANAILKMASMSKQKLREMGESGKSYCMKNFDLAIRTRELISHLKILSNKKT
ncbi:glycosyltransferase family 4 protein [Herbaspirillum sp. RV1423]|uniref:glycosyltransferase family 4 protein n=1 Tax=Herbaspirillum sp. RV1423 TaxID=1443993 RepID=UPI0004B15831|nr:glycosyltransferase family 4 protein [Herbaspirillum sp. RV1423]